MRKSVMTLLALATFASAPTARADTTFDVAIQLNDLLPVVKEAYVKCLTCTKDCQTSGNVVISEGITSHAFPADGPRTFVGTLTVVAKPKNPANENTATDYYCGLYLKDTAGNNWSVPQSGQAAYTPKAGTPFTPAVKGKLKK